MNTCRQQMTGSSRMLEVLLVVLLSGMLTRVPSAQTAVFACAAGDVACLIAAIHAANATGEADTITLAAGTYSLTAVDNDIDGPNGLPSMTSPLTIAGAGADTTILERTASAPSFRLMHVAAVGTLTLEGVTLRGGLSFGGGGLFNAGGTVAITKSRLTDHVIEGEGPGGGLFNGKGTVTITDSTLAHNRAAAGSGAAGGGVYSDGGTVTLRNSTLTSNHGSSGGGLFIANGRGSITNTTIVGNQGGYFGGGLYTYRATVTITQSTLASNEQGLLGGGLYATETSTVTMTQSAVIVNRASLSGGGLYIAGGSLVMITNSTVAGNQTLIDGGGGLYAGDTSTLTITNSTLADNAAPTQSGGGLFSVGGTVTLQNTILARNQATTGLDCAGPVTSLGHNLIGDPTDCTLALQPSDLTGDPQLGGFADAGVPGRGHFPLLPDSPAINAGHDAVCPETDQLGQPRVGRCDIGVIEFQPTLAAFVTGFYQDALVREPIPTEVADWMGFLQTDPTLARASAMVHAFFDGLEYRARPVTPWSHVTALYQAILGRAPDAAGLDWWVSVLLDRLNTALPIFIDSPEFHRLVPDCREASVVAALVARLYEEALGRTPSADEEMAWTQYILATCDLEGAVEAFFNSAEYLGVPGTLADHVTILYQALLAREPAVEEATFWLTYLAGQLALLEEGFIQSAEFQARWQQLFP